MSSISDPQTHPPSPPGGCRSVAGTPHARPHLQSERQRSSWNAECQISNTLNGTEIDIVWYRMNLDNSGLKNN